MDSQPTLVADSDNIQEIHLDPSSDDANNPQGDSIEENLQEETEVIKNVASTSKSKVTKRHAKKGKRKSPLPLALYCRRDCGVLVAAYAEYISDGIPILTHALDADYLWRRYAALLWKYSSDKACEGYISENGDPPRPKDMFIQPDRDRVVDLS